METLIHNMDQGSDEWFDIRLGKITGSEVSVVLGNGRKKDAIFTDAGYDYIYRKASEIITGDTKDHFSTNATEWGNHYEDYAINHYEAKNMCNVKCVGFYEVVGMNVGCSPDGVVSENGIIEVKCPYNSENHLRSILNDEVPKKYMPQVLFNMLVTDSDWCDFISFDDRFCGDNKMFVKRVLKSDYDEEISKIKEKVLEADSCIKKIVKRIKGW